VLAQATDLEVLDGAVGRVSQNRSVLSAGAPHWGKGLVSDMARSDLVAVGGS
jgi:hypothetical protein